MCDQRVIHYSSIQTSLPKKKLEKMVVCHLNATTIMHVPLTFAHFASVDDNDLSCRTEERSNLNAILFLLRCWGSFTDRTAREQREIGSEIDVNIECK